VVSLSNAMNQKPGLLCYSLNGQSSQPFLAGRCASRRRAPDAVRVLGRQCRHRRFARERWRSISTCASRREPDPALVVGAVVYAQWLTRDPGNAQGSFCSSDALRFAIGP
jgi:hypothetical protein